jgi:hypothetical protein
VTRHEPMSIGVVAAMLLLLLIFFGACIVLLRTADEHPRADEEADDGEGGTRMIDAGLIEELARWNVDLHRRVVELEEQDRRWMSRVAALKIELAEARAARETVHFHDLEID